MRFEYDSPHTHHPLASREISPDQSWQEVGRRFGHPNLKKNDSTPQPLLVPSPAHLPPGSRTEEGCLRFDLLRDQEQDNKFYFYEVRSANLCVGLSHTRKQLSSVAQNRHRVCAHVAH